MGAGASGRMVRYTILAVAVVGFLMVGLFLLGPLVGEWLSGSHADDPDERRIESAVRNASRICGLDSATENTRQIETSLITQVIKGSSGGQTNQRQTDTYLDVALSEAGQLQLRRETRECMAHQVDVLLNGDRGAQQPMPPPSAAGQSRVFYEGMNGETPTAGSFIETGSTTWVDGQFKFDEVSQSRDLVVLHDASRDLTATINYADNQIELTWPLGNLKWAITKVEGNAQPGAQQPP